MSTKTHFAHRGFSLGMCKYTSVCKFSAVQNGSVISCHVYLGSCAAPASYESKYPGLAVCFAACVIMMSRRVKSARPCAGENCGPIIVRGARVPSSNLPNDLLTLHLLRLKAAAAGASHLQLIVNRRAVSDVLAAPGGYHSLIYRPASFNYALPPFSLALIRIGRSPARSDPSTVSPFICCAEPPPVICPAAFISLHKKNTC